MDRKQALEELADKRRALDEEEIEIDISYARYCIGQIFRETIHHEAIEDSLVWLSKYIEQSKAPLRDLLDVLVEESK